VKNPLVGWWLEYYFFYVRHRDLADREEFQEMVLNPNADLSSLYTAADSKFYHFGNTIPWAKLCLDRVVEEYFRNEGETVLQGAIDGLPVASISLQSGLDSAVNAADFNPGDFDVDQDQDSTIMASELEAALQHWQALRAFKMTDQTYEDFLRTYGVGPAIPEDYKPELIRYVREWTYPTNTIDPTDGSPSSALSWSVAERADKDRFFAEPGFIFGVTVCRPKVYYRYQSGSLVGLMNDARSWLPAVMSDDYIYSFIHSAASSGPLPLNADADGYWIDIKDLFLYGDQFINYTIDDASNRVDLPTSTGNLRYPNATSADELFVTPESANKIRADGVVTMMIAGRLMDTSAPSPRMSYANPQV